MALTRKFNGKLYHFDTQHHNESRAQSRAERIRKDGGLARVVKSGLLTWEIWVRNA